MVRETSQIFRRMQSVVELIAHIKAPEGENPRYPSLNGVLVAVSAIFPAAGSFFPC
jgi:hypothetical protein